MNFLLNCYCIFTNFDCRFLSILISSFSIPDLMESTSYQELVYIKYVQRTSIKYNKYYSFRVNIAI